jgi:hypothetical protein
MTTLKEMEAAILSNFPVLDLKVKERGVEKERVEREG